MGSNQRPRNNSTHLQTLDFLTKKPTIRWTKSIFNKWCWYNWMSSHRKMHRSLLSSCTKLKPKWIKDLNIKPETLNLIKEKVGDSFECIGTQNNFLNRTSTAQTWRATINKWDLMKLKSFCTAKDIVVQKKWQPTEWEKMFTNYTLDQVCTRPFVYILWLPF